MDHVGSISGVWIPIWMFAFFFVVAAIDLARTRKG